MDVRVIELPAARMAVAGPGPDAEPLGDGVVPSRLGAWASARTDVLPLTARDLLWLDEPAGVLICGYVLAPEDDGGPWDVVEFPGGLYAVAVSRGLDDADGERVLRRIRAWVATSPLLLDERSGRPVAFRITSPGPGSVARTHEHHAVELLVPVRRADPLPRADG